MDVLSQALSAVRMTSAIFFDAEFSAPWGVAVPHFREVAAFLAPGTEHLINYHLVTKGEVRAELEGREAISLGAGDILILAHGDAHRLSHGAPRKYIDTRGGLNQYLAGDLVKFRHGGGGVESRIICGFFGCDRHAARLLLSGLPPMFSVHVRGDACGQWVENSIRHLSAESDSGRAGRSILLSKMAEALFIESLRRHMETMSEEETGWLAGARDPLVGRALALMHGAPRRAWTVVDLAEAAGASRATLSERFTRILGAPPLAYLTHWRLHLAARLLKSTGDNVLNVATEVGYESESAFNRAFKREFGVSPGRYRNSQAVPVPSEH